MKKCLISPCIAAAILCAPFAVSAQDVIPGFNPNLIIPDAAFNDTATFGGPAGIQRFLESKGSILADTSPEFLAKLSEPNDAALKSALGDPHPNLGRLRTAAELIWDASQISGLNPQVILVTLNKEQGLITGTLPPDRVQRALGHAMGFDCPDASGCGNLFPGFYYQMMGNVDTQGNRYLGAAKSLMKSFNAPTGRGPMIAGVTAHVGDSVQLDNTLGDYANILFQQLVTIGNRATAALYRYTPHVYNGNYNFWKFFTAWFKYPNGTLLASTQDRATYIVQDGSRQLVPAFVALVRAMNLGTAIPVSPTELENYPPGPTYGPPDNTLVTVDGAPFMFMGGVRHPISSFVVAQRKLQVEKSLPLSVADAGLFAFGSQLTPTDGTVLRGEQNPDVYLVDDGILKKYSAFTFNQRKAAKLLQVLPDSEVAIYPKQGYVAPLDGTVIRSASSTGAYVMSEQRRLPLTPELFTNLGLKTKDIVTLSSDEEIASIPLGPPSTPAEGTYFSYGDAHEFFLFKGGAKHPISPFVAKQRGMTPDYAFEPSIAGSWPEGIAIPPRDGTLLKGDASTATYVVMNGQLRMLTAEVFKNLKLKIKSVVTMPESDLGALAKGGFAPPADNTYFSTGAAGQFYVFKNDVKRLITPFVAKQRGMTPDFIFPAEAAADWPDGVPVSPREGTLIKAQGSPTTYVVANKLLRSLTDAAFKRRGYRAAKIKIIPASEVEALAKGEPIVK